MTKKTIAVTLAILAIAGSYLAYSKYTEHKFFESITPHVKHSSLLLANALRFETEKGTKVTYKELFVKLEADVSEIDKRILDIQTVATTKRKDETNLVLEYLRGSQVLMRCLLSKYRKELMLDSATEMAKRFISDLKSDSYYRRDYNGKVLKEASENIEKTEKEYDEAVSDLLSAAKQMGELRVKAASVMPDDTLVDNAIIEVVMKENGPNKRASNDQQTPNEQALRSAKNAYIEAQSFFSSNIKGKFSLENLLNSSGFKKQNDIEIEIRNGTFKNLEMIVFHKKGDKMYIVSCDGEITAKERFKGPQ